MKRGKFSLSYPHKLSCKSGELIPVGCTQVLPGDTVQHSTSALVRLSPLLSPVMHPLRVRLHHWYVPFRLIWDDFENFITGGPDGTDASVLPFVQLNGPTNISPGQLDDYLGVPTGVTGLKFSALRRRAYALIYNEWYRDEDLLNPIVVSKASGEDTTTNATIQNAAWEKDYFTTARPEAQKGPNIVIPVIGEGTAPVVTTDVQPFFNWNGVTDVGLRIDTNSHLYASGSPPGAASPLKFSNPTGLETDLSETEGLGINALDLREYMAMLRFEEARSRFGSRFTEYLRYLGVTPADARLQLPEYLGGGRETIQFSEVLQTAPGDEETDTVGALKGHGIGSMRSNRYRRFIPEHGYIMTMMSIIPQMNLIQGLPRDMMYATKEDFWQKELQFIGQQPVLKGEVYAQGTDADREVWAWQNRYDEYRQGFPKTSGQFRTTLDYWHMDRKFDSYPALNGDFVTARPTDRIFVDQTTGAEQYWVMMHHSIQARRLVAQTANSSKLF